MHKYDKNADGKIEMAEVSGAGSVDPRDAPGPPLTLVFHRDTCIPPRCSCSLQLAQILPTEENFLLCFRQHVGSSSEFMEVSGMGCARAAHGTWSSVPSSTTEKQFGAGIAQPTPASCKLLS